MTVVELYYAEWCKHCNDFKPEWEKIKKELDKLGIEHKEYEDGKNPDEIAAADVQGYPTIKITKDIIYEYNGPRTFDDVLKEVKSVKSPDSKTVVQAGGAKSKNYFMKYKKYKAKYLSLKAK